MGIDVAAFRNDRSLGVAIGNFANEMNALYVSHGDGIEFTDEAVATGLGPCSRSVLTFGMFFFDYDLDGRLDLFSANGHLEDDIHRVQSSQSYEQPAQLYWNAGSDEATEFLLVGREKCGDDLLAPTVGRGASFADIDGDGDLDVLVTAIARPARLLRNDQQLGHDWLRIKLEGSAGPRDAIGAWVEVHTAAGVLRQQVAPARSYLSQVELPLTFGLGRGTRIEKVVVRWPGGSLQEVKGVEPRQMIHVRQESAAVAAAGRAP
jgi:hypothetical protein